MALEDNANEIGECWLCEYPISNIKTANQGHVTGNHRDDCPLEQLAAALEKCIVVRHENLAVREMAEKALVERVDALRGSMTELNTPRCPFPVCQYSFAMGHRLECPFNSLR
jgi:hypothetical protein